MTQREWLRRTWQIITWHWPAVIVFFFWVGLVGGWFGRSYGVPNLFRDHPDLNEAISQADLFSLVFLSSPVFNIFLFMPLISAMVVTLAAVDIRRRRLRANEPELRFSPFNLMRGAVALTLITFVSFLTAVAINGLPDAARYGELVKRYADLASEQPALVARLRDLGVDAGTPYWSFVLQTMGRQLADNAGEIARGLAGIAVACLVLWPMMRVFAAWGLRAAAGGVSSYLALTAPYALFSIVVMYWFWLVPAMSIFALLGFILLIYFVFVFAGWWARLGMAAVAVGLLALANQEATYRFRVVFEDAAFTKALYENGVVDLGCVGRAAPQISAVTGKPCESTPATALASSAEGPPLEKLDPLAVLDAWAERAKGPQGRKPKLIVLATSGGAYRSAYWTALVLDHLSSKAPKLRDDVRLITGASGGMIGAAYFTVMERERRSEPQTAEACSIEQRITHDTYVGQFELIRPPGRQL